MRSSAATAEAIPIPPNMNMLLGGPTQIPGVTGRNQRCGLWVACRSKKSLSMRATESASRPAAQAVAGNAFLSVKDRDKAGDPPGEHRGHLVDLGLLGPLDLGG